MAESNDLTWEMDNAFIPKYVTDNLKWDEKIPQDITFQWNRSLNRLQGLHNLSVPR